MEQKPEKPPKLKAEEKQHMLKKIMKDKQAKKQSPSSKDNANVSEEKGDSSENTAEDKKEETRSETPSTSRSSPEPNCAICLEPLQNKSFTDSCFHTFCFTCLVEWSKVKPECPLCKQQFKSIVHNVQKDLSYDEYHISTRSTNNLWSIFGGSEQRFRYPTTMTASRIMERNASSYQDTYQSQIASHRMRYAPHSVRIYSSAQIVSRMPCDFRRRVYDEDLWVRPPYGSRLRLVSPEFYRRNPACTHRLLPWLNRELVALLQNNETQVTFVLELIMALVTRYEITSQEFLIHIEPYMGTRTRHFIHELYNFAVSPFEMENYDRHADYSMVLGQIPQTSSSPDSDVIPLDSEENNLCHRPVYEKKKGKRLKKLVLKKNGENSWESLVAPAVPRMGGAGSAFSAPGPSTSNYETPGSVIMLNGEPIRFTSLGDLEYTDDEECQIVDVVKPRHERTPEVVDLSSDEEKPQTVIDVSSDEESVSADGDPLIPTSLEELELGEIIDTMPEDGEFHEIADMTLPRTVSSPQLEVLDLRCVYEREKPSSSQEVRNESENSCTGKDRCENVRRKREGDEQESDTEELEDIEVSIEQEVNAAKVPTLASAIVRPWTMKSDTSESWSPVVKHKRHAPASYFDDSLTESCSENEANNDRTSGGKKLKLRSVVAHFSFDHSDNKHESGHRSSHKKHKDRKKKKKKKHIHRHKRRIISDSGSS